MIQFPIIIGIIDWILIFIILIFKILFVMKMFNWLKESNRLSHLKVSFGIWVIVMLFGCTILSIFEEITSFESIQANAITVTCSLFATLSVFISMCSVEYTQKACGNKWDWLDILAGCLIPIFITIIIILCVVL